MNCTTEVKYNGDLSKTPRFEINPENEELEQNFIKNFENREKLWKNQKCYQFRKQYYE